MNILEARMSDAAEILALQKLAYRSEVDIYHDDTIEPMVQTLEDLHKQFEDHVILKAVVDDSIIGSVRAYAANGTCYIGKLFVHPNFQNKGIGKKLMTAIEEIYQPSCTQYKLFTGHKSVKNIQLYASLGYTIFDTRAMGPDFSLVYMEKVSYLR